MIATDNLSHLHDPLRNGIALVAELEELLRGRDGVAAKRAGFDRVIGYLRAVVLPHLQGELAVLYPESEMLTGIDETLVHRLIDNCEELQCYAERIVRDRDRLGRGACDNMGYRRHITALVRLLRRHMEGVEQLLLPELAARLSDEAIYAVYERIEEIQFEARIELSKAS